MDAKKIPHVRMEEPYGFPDGDFRHTRKLNDFIVFPLHSRAPQDFLLKLHSGFFLSSKCGKILCRKLEEKQHCVVKLIH